MRKWIDIVESTSGAPSDVFLQQARALNLPAETKIGRVDDHTVELISIFASERGKGHGGQTMSALCELADRLQVTIELFPRSAVEYGWDNDEDFSDALSQTDLEDWYFGMGFDVVDNRSEWSNAEFDDSLVRRPRPLTENVNVSWEEPNRSYDPADYAVVTIDVEKLAQSWAKDRFGYIDGPSHENAIGRRYDAFGEWFEKGDPVGMSLVAISPWGHITFGNGRHRFAWLRDKGVKTMPVLCPREQEEEIKNRFGA